MTTSLFLRIGGLLASAVLAGCGSTIDSSGGGHRTSTPAPLHNDDGPAGSVEQGRRLFAANCVRCHGSNARGTADAPDLLPRVRGMSPDRFNVVVLRRYTWTVAASEAGSESALREAMARGLLQAQPTPGSMPAWDGVPAVKSGMADLYRYLDSEAAKPPR